MAQQRQPVMVTHEIWMMLNCGVPDGGCSCNGPDVRPEGGYAGVSFETIGRILGRHLDRALGPGRP